MHLLCNHGHFPRQWIGRRGPIQWPQLSDDTPCVLLLWAWAEEEAADRNHKQLMSWNNKFETLLPLLLLAYYGKVSSLCPPGCIMLQPLLKS